MEPDYILEWFRFAEKDIISAERNTTFHPVHMQLVCYLCQQSAEKNLKGYLVYKGIDEPQKTHNLDVLCDQCLTFDAQFEEIYDQCEMLSAYGVQPRYPHEMEISESNMEKALVCARQIHEFELIQAARQALEEKSEK